MNCYCNKVDLIGFDSRSVKFFDDFFNEKCGQEFRLTKDQNDSDITILDIDVMPRSELVNEFRRNHPFKPLIVLSLLAHQHDDHLVFSLKKPVVHADFYKLLQQVVLVTDKNRSPSTELSSALLEHIHQNIENHNRQRSRKNGSCFSLNSPHDRARLTSMIGRQADINIENPQAVMRVLFDPSLLLLGSIKKGMARAERGQKIIELTNFGHKFLIDPHKKTITTFVSESVLRPLCLMWLQDAAEVKVFKNPKTSVYYRDLMSEGAHEIKVWPWESFLWTIGLWTSRGKLPRDTDIKKPVYLSHWPNMTQLQLFPHAMEIAAVLLNKPTRLNDIAEQLGIEQKYVFAFYSAANAAGIAQNSKRQCDTLFEPEKIQNEAVASLFHKVFAYLSSPVKNSGSLVRKASD